MHCSAEEAYGESASALWFYGIRVAALALLIAPVALRWALAAAAHNERKLLAGQVVHSRTLSAALAWTLNEPASPA